MKNVFIFELRRGFGSRGFKIAIVVGIVLAVGQLVTVSIPYSFADVWSAWRNGSSGAVPPSFYTTWIGLTPYSVFTMAFYYSLPLLACIPAADSLCVDIHSGYARQVAIRTGRQTYVIAKLFAVVTAGITVVVVSLAINIVGTACFVPAFFPDPAAGTFFVDSSNMLAELYYRQPLLFIVAFVGLALALAMVCTALSCTLSFAIENRFVVMLAPIVFCLVLQFALQGVSIAGFSPINVISPWQPFDASIVPAVMLFLAFFLIEFASLFVQGCSYEGC